MSVENAGVDGRGGGDTSRTDAFRFAPGNGVYAFAAIGGLGALVIALVLLDVAGAGQRGDAILAVAAGALLILVMLALFWLTRRRPVLLAIGPRGLDMPHALVRPVAWSEIWRIRRTRRRLSLWQELVMLKVELIDGIRPRYKRRLWTWPMLDSWLAARIGLRIPLHNLDADQEIILASVERFRPVQRVTT